MLNISEWNPSILLKEIRSRIEMAKKVFTEKKKLFIGEMNLELKKRFSEDETMSSIHLDDVLSAASAS